MWKILLYSKAAQFGLKQITIILDKHSYFSMFHDNDNIIDAPVV